MTSINPKINKESKKLLEDYNENQRQFVLATHKGVLGFILVTNIILVCFVVAYKIQISGAVQENKELLEGLLSIEKQRDDISNEIEVKLVNLNALINNQYNYFSLTIQTIEEYNTILSFLGPPENPGESFHLSIIFQAKFGNLNTPENFKEVFYYERLLFIFREQGGKRFGGFLSTIPSGLTDNKEHTIEDKNAFLFSIDDKRKFPIKDPKNAFTTFEGGFFKFSDDLIIEEIDLGNKGGFSIFPTSYECKDCTGETNALTGVEGNKFVVTNFEIFSVYSY